MRFAIVVTGPAYGMQQASSAFQFAQALIAEGHELSCVFFYREGVYNANQLTSPASDEFDLVRGWQQLNAQHGVALNICVAAALRRGIVDETEAWGWLHRYAAVSSMKLKQEGWGWLRQIFSRDLP